MSFLTTLAGIGMAVGPPLAYADQFLAILRKRNSNGFSIDICGVLIIANITRVWYWLGARFETPLLVQSLLMILAQFALLYVCLKYDPAAQRDDQEEEELLAGSNKKSVPMKSTSNRPFNFWAWTSYGSFVEFTAAFIVLHSVLYLILHSFSFYVEALGVAALGLEATLPLPQLVSNYKRKSTAGFRMSVLASWIGGDFIKSIYFFVKDGNSAVFKAAACFQLSVDVLLCIQTYYYRAQTQRDLESEEVGRGEEEEI